MPVHRHPIAASRSEDPLPALPLDVGLIERLKATYAIVRADGIRLAEIFYAKLFAAAPQVRSMFRADPSVQAEKLIAALDAVVANLERPSENSAMLVAMGRRHAGYGVKPEHYDLVTDLLVESMRELLAARAQSRELEEWRMALRLISNQMIAAGE